MAGRTLMTSERDEPPRPHTAAPGDPVGRATTPRWSGDWSRPAWITTAFGASVTTLLTLATYDPLADGDMAAFRTHVIASVCFGVLGACAVAIHAGFRHLGAPVALLACALVPGSLHGLRMTNPYLRGEPLAEVVASKETPTAWGAHWEHLTPDPSAIALQADGSLQVVVRPWKSASLRAQLPVPRPISPWIAPLGMNRAVVHEAIDVAVAVNRTGNYLGIMQANRTRVQVVPYGIKLTVPDARGDVGSIDIPDKTWEDGERHRWQLVGTSARLALKLDGSTLWEGPQREPLGPVLIGDAQSDAEHGGSMTIERARFTRRLTLGPT